MLWTRSLACGAWLAAVVIALAGCRARSAAVAATPADVAAPDRPGVTWGAGRRWVQIGTSIQGQGIEVRTIGTGPKRLYLIGGIHGNEPEGLGAAVHLSRWSEDELTGVTLRIVRDANPDGTVKGTRGNVRGRDLNRNWPAANFGSSRAETPLSEPETRALHADILEFNPDVIVVFHSIASGPFVNFDGPAEELAETFARAARRIDERWKVVRHMGYGTPGSMGSYFGVDRGVAILTVEFKRGQESESAIKAAIAGFRALINRPQLPKAMPRTGEAKLP